MLFLRPSRNWSSSINIVVISELYFGIVVSYLFIFFLVAHFCGTFRSRVSHLPLRWVYDSIFHCLCVCVWQIRQSGVRASAPDFALSASLARAKIESTFKRVLKNQEQLAIEMKPANRRMNQQGIRIERKKEPKNERNNNVHISTWYASPRANIKRTMST